MLLKDKMRHQSVRFEELTSILSHLNNFHSLEVVDRVSETQLQVGEKFKLNIMAVKGLKYFAMPQDNNYLLEK